MAVLYRFEVFTPYRMFFAENVESVSLRISDGEIGILAHHSPFIAPVVPGVLRIKTNTGKWCNAFVASGILEVTEIKTVLMVDSAEWPEEIDIERVAAAEKKARINLETALLKFETDQAKDEIRRSQVRLAVAKMEQPSP